MTTIRVCFSALQRAENSSKGGDLPRQRRQRVFQCSSASRKFLKSRSRLNRQRTPPRCFSALQRAENSSNEPVGTRRRDRRGFSALQRAENSSKRPQRTAADRDVRVSVLFSEPKIPQNSRSTRAPFSVRVFQCSSASRKFLKGRSSSRRSVVDAVSVLFSEPKIPQKDLPNLDGYKELAFQCSSASRKFLKRSATARWR